MPMQIPDAVTIFEVAARDGFQNEPEVVPTDQKVILIDRLSQAGMKDIEVGSFVNPRRVPQVADTEEVLSRIQRAPGARYWVLVPNPRGYERALAVSHSEIAVFMSSSESHNQSNVNRSIRQSLAELSEIIRDASGRGMGVRAYVSTVFGCPFEGDVPVEAVIDVAGPLLEAGADQISLGDTIGVANPRQVDAVMARLTEALPLERLALHFHDTRGVALANCLAGLQAGVRVFDSALGGIGGCPFAPGATGNLATEDLLQMLTAMGISTGLELDEVCDVGILLGELLSRPLPSRYHQVHVGLKRRDAERAARVG